MALGWLLNLGFAGSGSADRNVSANLESLTLTTFAATVKRNRAVTASVESLSLSTFKATITRGAATGRRPGAAGYHGPPREKPEWLKQIEEEDELVMDFIKAFLKEAA